MGGSVPTCRGPTRGAVGTSSPPGAGTCRGRTRSGCSTRSATRAPSPSSGRMRAWTGSSGLRKRWSSCAAFPSAHRMRPSTRPSPPADPRNNAPAAPLRRRVITSPGRGRCHLKILTKDLHETESTRYSWCMSDYTPPIKDIMFALEHVVGYPDIAKLPGFEHADLESVGDVLDAFGEFAAEIVAPTNRSGDLQGAVLGDDGTVTTSPGFKEAYQQYVESGWGAVPLPEQYGGGDFPRT